jgi:hypothetical protein
MIAHDYIRRAWFESPGQTVITESGMRIKVEFVRYKNHPVTAVKLCLFKPGMPLNGQEIESVVGSARRITEAPPPQSVTSDFGGVVTVVWDVRGPKAPRGAGKEQKQRQKREKTPKSGTEAIVIFDGGAQC